MFITVYVLFLRMVSATPKATLRPCKRSDFGGAYPTKGE